MVDVGSSQAASLPTRQSAGRLLVVLFCALLIGGCTSKPVRMESSEHPTETTEGSAANVEFADGDGDNHNVSEPLAPQQPNQTSSVARPVPAPSSDRSSVTLLQSPDDPASGDALFNRLRDGMVEPDCVSGRVVDRWISQYQQRPTSWQQLWEPSMPLLDWVARELAEQQLPAEFALIPLVESDYRPKARNRNNAGMWQLSAGTARELGLRVDASHDDRLDPQRATAAAILLLQRLMERFGDWRLAAMAYNAGEYRLARAVEKSDSDRLASAASHHPPGLSMTTYEYLAKLEALTCLIVNPDDHRLALPDQPFTPLAQIEAEGPIGYLTTLEQYADIDSRTAIALNPFLLSGRSSGASLLLPEPDAMRVKQLTLEMAAGRMPEPVTAVHSTHRVESGDSLWKIARQYDVTISDLKRWNLLSPDSVLQPGQLLRLEP